MSGVELPGLTKRWLREHPEVHALLADWPPERVRACLDTALVRWELVELVSRIDWRWNPRLRTTAGRARFDGLLIELNPLLLARHPEEVEALIVHETAHLVVHLKHGRQPPHGAVWKSYMRRAGQSTRATHQLDVVGLRRAPGKRRRRRRRAAASGARILRRLFLG